METEEFQIARGTYAQVLQRKDDKVIARPPALHSVIVASNDEKETGEEVLEKVRKTVHAKDGWVTIDKVRKVKDRKTVHIDMKRSRVEDQSPLIQCSTCLGYGHGRKYCKEITPKCSHCGGSHLRKECEEYVARVTPRCCDCAAAKHTQADDTEHNAFSSDCPIRRRWEMAARARVAYC
ncbi:hypothetical protein ACJJTC_014367 [Scirpophaga incertulas]